MRAREIQITSLNILPNDLPGFKGKCNKLELQTSFQWKPQSFMPLFPPLTGKTVGDLSCYYLTWVSRFQQSLLVQTKEYTGTFPKWYFYVKIKPDLKIFDKIVLPPQWQRYHKTYQWKRHNTAKTEHDWNQGSNLHLTNCNQVRYP